MEKFKLQTVLDYRQRLEGLAQQAHAEAIAREAQLAAQLGEKRQGLNALQQEFDERQRQGIDPQEFPLYRNHIGQLKEELQAVIRSWEAAKRAVVEKRTLLCKAGRDKELLERLRQKHLQEQKTLAAQKEAIFLDEIAVQHFKR